MAAVAAVAAATGVVDAIPPSSSSPLAMHTLLYLLLLSLVFLL